MNISSKKNFYYTWLAPKEAENLANIKLGVFYRIALRVFFDFRIPREDEAITTRIQPYGAV